MDRLIAERLRGDPAVLAKAHKVLEKWIASCEESVRHTLGEWRSILDGPLPGIIEALEGEDENSVRLRQSSSFCGILTPAKRASILMPHARDR